MLVDALRESQTPTDEDVIYGVLGALLVSPVISVQAEKKKYQELLRDNGYVSVPALQRLTAGKLVADGSQHGSRGPGVGSAVRAGWMGLQQKARSTARGCAAQCGEDWGRFRGWG